MQKDVEQAVFLNKDPIEKRDAILAYDEAVERLVALEAELRKMKKRKFGGAVFTNIPYLVGEAGPELFIPKTDGMIKNEQQTNQMMQSAVGKGGGGGATVVNAPTFAPMSSSSSSTTSTSAPIVQLDPILNRASQYAI